MFQPPGSICHSRRGATGRTCGLIIASICCVQALGSSLRRPLTKTHPAWVYAKAAISQFRPSEAVSAFTTGPVRDSTAARTPGGMSSQRIRDRGTGLSSLLGVGEGPSRRSIGRGTALSREPCSVRLVVAGSAATCGRLDQRVQVFDEHDLAGVVRAWRDL